MKWIRKLLCLERKNEVITNLSDFKNSINNRISEVKNKISEGFAEGLQSLQETNHKISEIKSKIDEGLQGTDRKILEIKSKISEGLAEGLQSLQKTNHKISEIKNEISEGLIARLQTLQETNYEVSNQVNAMEEALKKMGRSQLRSNTLADSQRSDIQQNLQKLLQASLGPQKETLLEVVQIVDGLEEGLNNSQKIDNVEIATWAQGFSIVHEKMLRLLEKWEVYPMNSTGEMFNPELHQAVDVVFSSDMDEGVIVEEQCRGYFWGNDVLRYAEVIVSKKPDH